MNAQIIKSLKVSVMAVAATAFVTACGEDASNSGSGDSQNPVAVTDEIELANGEEVVCNRKMEGTVAVTADAGYFKCKDGEWVKIKKLEALKADSILGEETEDGLDDDNDSDKDEVVPGSSSRVTPSSAEGSSSSMTKSSSSRRSGIFDDEDDGDGDENKDEENKDDENDDGPVEKSSSSSAREYAVDLLDELPECTSKRENATAEVGETGKKYVCEDGEWISITMSSSSSKVSTKSSSSAAKSSNSSGDEMEDSSSSVTTSLYKCADGTYVTKKELCSEPNSSAESSGSSAASTSGTSAETTTSSSAIPVTPSTKGFIVSDFAYDECSALTIRGKESCWYSYLIPGDARNGMGTATITNPVDAEYGRNKVFHEEGYMGLDGIVLDKGAYQYTPQVALGIEATAGELASCTTINYRYKGAAHYLKVQMTGEADGDPQHRASQIAATDWTTASVSAAAMKPGWESPTATTLDMAKAIKMAFVIESETTPNPNYLYIDDVTCGDVASVAPGTVIDDFSDGNNVAESISDFAYWRAFESDCTIDNEREGSSPQAHFTVVDPTNGYAFLKGISGVTYGSYYYPTAGLYLLVDGALANCAAITYDYKGSAHRFRAAMYTITPGQGYEHTTEDAGFPMADDWSTVTVSASDLYQPTWVMMTSSDEYQDFSWSKVNIIFWIVDEKIPVTGPDLYIDNVRCVGNDL